VMAMGGVKVRLPDDILWDSAAQKWAANEGFDLEGIEKIKKASLKDEKVALAEEIGWPFAEAGDLRYGWGVLGIKQIPAWYAVREMLKGRPVEQVGPVGMGEEAMGWPICAVDWHTMGRIAYAIAARKLGMSLDAVADHMFVFEGAVLGGQVMRLGYAAYRLPEDEDKIMKAARGCVKWLVEQKVKVGEFRALLDLRHSSSGSGAQQLMLML